MYAIIVDEASDNSCTEQMSMCVRYVKSVCQCPIVKRFLAFVPLEMSAEAFTSKITDFLADIETLHCSGLRLSIRNVRRKQITRN